MTDFDKELVSALKDFEDRNITLASYMERVKQAVDKYVIGENDEESIRELSRTTDYDIASNMRDEHINRNQLRVDQRQSLWGDKS